MDRLELHPTPVGVALKEYDSSVLHNELMTFFLYLMPSELEEKARIQSNLQGSLACLHCFSVRLFFHWLVPPTSDLDISVQECPVAPKKAIHILHSRLMRVERNCFGFQKTLIDPIVAEESTFFILSRLNQHEALKPLVFLVKFFLYQHKLHEANLGGLGSYAVVLMSVSLLEEYSRLGTTSVDLGDTLIRFFDYYGNRFDYVNNVICCSDQLVKTKQAKAWTNEAFPERLSIEDPADPGKSCQKIDQVKQLFSDLHERLSNNTPLKNILSDYSGIIEHRSFLARNFTLHAQNRHHMSTPMPQQIQHSQQTQQSVNITPPPPSSTLKRKERKRSKLVQSPSKTGKKKKPEHKQNQQQQPEQKYYKQAQQKSRAHGEKDERPAKKHKR